MAKLIDKLENEQANQGQPTELARDVVTLRQIPIAISSVVKYQMTTLNGLANKHGMTTLVAALPVDEQADFLALLATLQALWAAASDQTLPALSSDPVPPVEQPA